MSTQKSDIIAVVALIVVFGVTLTLDVWLVSARQAASRSSEGASTVLLAGILSNLIFAALMAVLVWLLIRRIQVSTWVSLLYVVVGLFFGLMPLRLWGQHIPVLPSLYSLPGILQLWDIVFTNGLHAYTFIAGAFAVVIGIGTAIRTRNVQTETEM